MYKWLLRKKLLQVRLSTCVGCVLGLIAIVQLLTTHGTYNYAHVSREHIWDQLFKATSPNLTLDKHKPYCSYAEILASSSSVPSWEASKKYDKFLPSSIVDGSFSPDWCNPLFSVAILVPYRDRPDQLATFLLYMHNLLQKQNIHYKIFVIEQADKGAFNRGRLFNVGAARAHAEGFPCLVLHDVDLLPLTRSLHACLRQPRHMSASIDKFRFVLPYAGIVGGVLAIQDEQYRLINGFSNRFEGWGGEDDDLYGRITDNNLTILRFPVELSRYTMLRHPPERRGRERARVRGEGLRSLHCRGVHVSAQPLYTNISVTF